MNVPAPQDQGPDRPTARRFWRVPLYSNALYMMAGGGFTAIMGFAFWTLAARLYTAHDVGLMSAAIAALGLIGTLGNLGLGTGVVRFLPRDDSRATGFVYFSLALATAASAVIAGVFLLGVPLWSSDLDFLRRDGLQSAFFILLAVLTALSGVVDGVFVARRRASFVMTRGLVMAAAKLSLVALLAISLQATGILAAWGAGLAVSVAVALVLFVPRLVSGFWRPSTMAFSGRKGLVGYSLVNNAAALLGGLPGQVLPLMLLGLLGAEANAYFYMPWQVMAALSMVPSAVATSLFAEGCHDEATLLRDVWRSLRLALAILLPLAAGLVVFAEPLLRVFGAEYGVSANLLRVLAVSLLPLCVNHLYFSVLRVRSRLGALSAINGFITLATLAIAYVLLPRMGSLGAGLGWLAGQTLAALWIAAGRGRWRLLLGQARAKQ